MSWHKRVVSFGLLTLIFSNSPFIAKAQNPLEGTGIVALTQDNGQSNNQDTPPSIKQQPAPKVDLPTLRTGVDPNKVMKLSLQEAVTMALERNLGIKNEQDNIKLAQFDLEGAQGVYDPIVGGSFMFARNNSLSASRFNMAVGSSTNQSQSVTFGVNASRLFANGAQGEASFGINRSTTNSNFSLFNPAYVPRFEIKLTQPLMKNFRINQNTRNLQALRKQLDLADLAFRQKLVDLIARVQSSYYDLGFSIKNAEIQRESVELAAVQLRNNEIQVKAGTAAPIDIVSAQAELERRKDSAISALVPITQAENALKLLLLDDPISDLMNYQIVPTDLIDVSAEKMDLNTAIGIAMDRRPEIKQLQIRDEVNKVDIEFFKNQLKPQVNLVTSFSLQGLAGDPGVPDFKGSDLDGGLGKSLVNLFKARTYEAGISITLPYKNTTVKSNLARTEVVTRQLDNQKRQMVLSIVTDVRNALQFVESSLQRVEAARASVKAAEEQLRGEEQKFAAGLSTTFFVLQRQNELSVARGNELRAKTDYNKARADLQRVMANNLP